MKVFDECSISLVENISVHHQKKEINDGEKLDLHKLFKIKIFTWNLMEEFLKAFLMRAYQSFLKFYLLSVSFHMSEMIDT